MAKVTYENKVNFVDDSSIPDNEKISAEDINEIKSVINMNRDDTDNSIKNVFDLIGELRGAFDDYCLAVSNQFNAISNDIKNKQEILTKGTYEGSLDDLRDLGWYWCNFSNCTESPYSNGFGWIEIIKPVISSQSCLQKIYRFNANVGISEEMLRPYTNNQWYPWRKIVTVAIS